MKITPNKKSTYFFTLVLSLNQYPIIIHGSLQSKSNDKVTHNILDNKLTVSHISDVDFRDDIKELYKIEDKNIKEIEQEILNEFKHNIEKNNDKEEKMNQIVENTLQRTKDYCEKICEKLDSKEITQKGDEKSLLASFDKMLKVSTRGLSAALCQYESIQNNMKPIKENQFDTGMEKIKEYRKEMLNHRKEKFEQNFANANKVIKLKMSVKEKELKVAQENFDEQEREARKKLEMDIDTANKAIETKRKNYKMELDNKREIDKQDIENKEKQHQVELNCAKDKHAEEMKEMQDMQNLKYKEKREEYQLKIDTNLAMENARLNTLKKINKEKREHRDQEEIYRIFDLYMTQYKEELREAEEAVKGAKKYHITNVEPKIEIDDNGKKYVVPGRVTYTFEEKNCLIQ